MENLIDNNTNITFSLVEPFSHPKPLSTVPIPISNKTIDVNTHVGTPTLCLNMIVKNEAKIIRRLLQSVAPIIDSYCICDTGSTDNTIEIIETFFAQKNIPGKIVKEPFQDFGYNRTFALKACHGMSNADFLLLLDADMIFTLNPAIQSHPHLFKQILAKGDVHNIFQGSEAMYYKNVRIIRNVEGISYWGVTHEYVECPDGSVHFNIEKSVAFIHDIGDGGSKSDKFIRDIRLLKKGLETHPDNVRYMFYLANSLRDNGDHAEAIETYKKRIQLGGWIEEVWFSWFSIGHIYKRLGDMPNAVHAWMEAYHAFPSRIENLYEIVNYYRCTTKYSLAYPFYVLGKNVLKNTESPDFLFMQKDVYDYKLDYEMTILGYYCNTDSYDLVALSMKVFNYPFLDKGISDNILSNYKFYAKKWGDLYVSKMVTTSTKSAKLVAFLNNANLGEDLLKQCPDQADFVSSTPSILRLDENKYMCCVRYVNYSVDDQGKYVQKSTIESKNILVTIEWTNKESADGIWEKTSEVFLQHDRTLDGYYIGIEDVRLYLTSSNNIGYNGNRGLTDGTMNVETGFIVDGKTTVPPSFPKIPDQGSLEKNWVVVPGVDPHNQRMIYGWWPLVVGEIVDSEFKEVSRSQDVPLFFRYLRGSTNGIVIGDEIWFICHLVSYEDRRYYYHIMVVLNRSDLSVKSYTPIFTFEGEKVEYTLGFCLADESDQFIIGYSVMDKTTKYMTVDKTVVDKMMIPHSRV